MQEKKQGNAGEFLNFVRSLEGQMSPIGRFEFTFKMLLSVQDMFRTAGFPPETYGLEARHRVGFLLGETIVRNLPHCKWTNLESYRLREAAIEVQPKDPKALKYVVHPVSKALKFFDDHSEGLTPLYKTVDILTKYTLKEAMKIGEPMGDGWYKFDGDLLLRMLATDAKTIEERRGEGIRITDRPVIFNPKTDKLITRPMFSKDSPLNRNDKN